MVKIRGEKLCEEDFMVKIRAKDRSFAKRLYGENNRKR